MIIDHNTMQNQILHRRSIPPKAHMCPNQPKPYFGSSSLIQQPETKHTKHDDPTHDSQLHTNMHEE